MTGSGKRPVDAATAAPADAPPAAPLEMDPEAMRAAGYQAVDMLVDRWSRLADEVAWVGATRAELEARLPDEAPESGAPISEVMERARTEALEIAGRVDHPRFMAFVPSAPTWPGVLGDFLASGYNVFQGTWLESAGPSRMELVVLEWFRRWIGLPAGAGGLFTSGGSAANLISVVTAREAAGNPSRPTVYLSDQAHSSLERAAWIAGVPRDQVRRIPSDTDFRMVVPVLEKALTEDHERGYTPIWVGCSAGATNTGAVDPLRDIAEVCRREGVWLHVDGAYGGFAALTREGAALLDGIGEADSVTLDPHKWLFQPFEAGCLLVREVERLETAFRILPEYLQDVELGREQVNFADRGLQLTRSFRALKVWLSVQTFGVATFRHAVQCGFDRARDAERSIRGAPDLELLSPARLGIVCYRYHPGDEALTEPELERLNRSIQERIVAEGVMVSSTRLRGRFALRLCILNPRTTRADVESVIERVRTLGRAGAPGAAGEAPAADRRGERPTSDPGSDPSTSGDPPPPGDARRSAGSGGS